MKKFIFLFLLPAVGAFLHYQSGPAKEREAIGRWQITAIRPGMSGTMTVVLGEDKRFKMGFAGTKFGQPITLNVEGDWRILANHLRLTVTKCSNPQLAGGTEIGGPIVRLDQSQLVYKTTSGDEVMQRIK